MNIEELLPDSYRKTIDLATEFICKHSEFIPKLLIELENGKPVLAMRTSRVIQITHVQNPEIIHPYLSELLQILLKLSAQGTIRSLLYVFQTAWKNLNEDEFGYLIDFAFTKFEDVSSEPAVRVYALVILNNVLDKIPEIKDELIQLMEFHYTEGSPALKGVIRKLAKQNH
jgi:hypothetical protein